MRVSGLAGTFGHKTPLLRYLLILGLVLPILGCDSGGQPLSLAGGPGGGTFQGFAEALATTVRSLNPELQLEVRATGGSVANLISLHRREHDLGLVYAGDAYLGRIGQLASISPEIKNVRAVCRLYGAAAQLIVPAGSRFATPHDLAGARVAVGNPGSGTAIAAERYFTSLGLWGRIIPIYVGFSMGMAELQKGQVAALWMLVGFPNQSVHRWFEDSPLRLLPLTELAEKNHFRTRYPFYEPVSIPAATYPGQASPVTSFMDSTLLLAGLQVPESLVFQLLDTLYSPAGQQQLQASHPLGTEMTLAHGRQGIRIPLHAGAERFWQQRATGD